MKITSVDVITTAPYRKGAQAVFARVNTDEGIWGTGEAGVRIENYSLGCAPLIKVMAKKIIGMNPLYIDQIYDVLVSSFWAQGNGGVIMAAISAIDVALWDIKGKYFNVPCYVLLGGKHRDKLWTYASQLQGGWKDPEFPKCPPDTGYLREAIAKAKDEGYTAVKIDFLNNKLDGSPSPKTNSGFLRNFIPKDYLRDYIKRLDAARDECGPDVEIMMENHDATSANTALQLAKLAEPYDIMFMEEPATPLNPLEYQRLAQQTSIPLATGERSYTRAGFLPLLQTGCVSVIQPDITNCGGITEARKICDLADAFGITVQTHTCNSPISIVAALHLEAAIPNFCIHEHHTNNTIPSVTSQCVYDYQPVNGYYDIPELPGLGNELSEELLKNAFIETVKADV